MCLTLRNAIVDRYKKSLENVKKGEKNRTENL